MFMMQSKLDPPIQKKIYIYIYICSAQFANLRNFEIALHKLEIAKLQTNFETGIQFRNCVALLRILEIALFLKQTMPIDTIMARSAQRRLVLCTAAVYNRVKQICTFL